MAQAEVDDIQGNNLASQWLSADIPNPDQQAPGLANVATCGLKEALPDKDLQEQVEATRRALNSDLEKAGDFAQTRGKPKVKRGRKRQH
ncbi:hypothetical protein HPB50_026676 [Hyalomma asiaticum]|uniref:Uncharacterized protein n=1 Tax=Hyalomma asiaticum TaxID=266040 RepID=A0ACB7TP94_HYAAI|nr:hypothetical protein HPB50_026676 [Hyalomma asiaticum]